MRLLLLLLLAGCTDFLAPMPGDPALMEMSPLWRDLYAKAEQCTGKTGDFERVRWYGYPGQRLPEGNGVPRGAAAYTWEREHKIAIAQNWFGVESIIIHEAIHDILGVRGHPTKYFGTLDEKTDDWSGGLCSSLINDTATGAH